MILLLRNLLTGRLLSSSQKRILVQGLTRSATKIELAQTSGIANRLNNADFVVRGKILPDQFSR